MLSDRSRPVLEATLPVVADNIGEIATRFYAHLSEEHPGLFDVSSTGATRRSGPSS